MTREDYVLSVFAEANPVPDPEAYLERRPARLVTLEQRSTEMVHTELPQSAPTQQGSKRKGGLVAAAAALVVLIAGLGSWLLSRSDSDRPEPAQPTTSIEKAIAFWEAVESRDLEAALAQMDPARVNDNEAMPFGRDSATLQDKFAWYEAVDWSWALQECVEFDRSAVECTLIGRNAWSDALGVEPVTGTFLVFIGENGINVVDDKNDSFQDQWGPRVFDVFGGWVETNHPDDAEVMFGDDQVNQEILDLFELNTARFVDALQGG
jgi:hypothetical protein